MKNGPICLLLAAALLTALCGCTAQTAEPAAEPVVIQANIETPRAVVAETIVETPEPEPTLRLKDDAAHPALMSLKSDGLFHPNAPVTRGELCALLAPLLDGLKAGKMPFSDVKRSDSAYLAIARLYNAGVLPDEAGAAFRPEASAVRAWLGEVLSGLADALGGEEAQNARLLAMDAAAGVTAPEGRDTAENALITRGETAVILIRLLGREPDAENLFMNGKKPADMDPDDPLWPVCADAVTEGVVKPVSGGVHRLYGWLYAAWDDGTMVTDMDYGVWTFGPDGRYTTGDGELDGFLFDALEESGANALDGVDALKAAYLYIKYNFSYLVRPEDMETIPVGVTGWEYERALRFFRYGGGTCYGYAAAFGLLARALGEHAYVVAAEVNQYYGAHGFVVIPEGETDVIYDVELEATRPERHGDFDLFAIRNNEIYNYWYVANWRGE